MTYSELLIDLETLQKSLSKSYYTAVECMEDWASVNKIMEADSARVVANNLKTELHRVSALRQKVIKLADEEVRQEEAYDSVTA